MQTIFFATAGIVQLTYMFGITCLNSKHIVFLHSIETDEISFHKVNEHIQDWTELFYGEIFELYWLTI